MEDIFAAYNIPNKPQRSGWGDFMSGIGSGLQQLAERKVQEHVEREKNKRLQETLGKIGVTPEQSELLMHLKEIDPKLYSDYVGRALESSMSSGSQQSDYDTSSMPDFSKDSSLESSDFDQPSQSIASQKPKNLFESKESKKMAAEEQKVINKEVYPYIKDLRAKAKGAKENDMRLKRMEKLIESGNLNNPAFVSLLRSLRHGIGGYIGLDLTGMLSGETQEFDKLSNDFVKNIKDIFGSRITDQDLKSFMATIPQSTQTNEGKRAVINNLRLFNEAAYLREKAASALLKKYGNKPPLDFEEQVENLVKPKLDEIAKRFESGEDKTKKTPRTRSIIQDVVGGRGLNLLERA